MGPSYINGEAIDDRLAHTCAQARGEVASLLLDLIDSQIGGEWRDHPLLVRILAASTAVERLFMRAAVEGSSSAAVAALHQQFMILVRSVGSYGTKPLRGEARKSEDLRACLGDLQNQTVNLKTKMAKNATMDDTMDVFFSVLESLPALYAGVVATGHSQIDCARNTWNLFYAVDTLLVPEGKLLEWKVQGLLGYTDRLSSEVYFDKELYELLDSRQTRKGHRGHGSSARRHSYHHHR